ncbi:AMP-dependent synthetase/ligase [Mucilaginibacter phyllosphaerae]|uniref:Long-chain acyl-CoA synthetase n=1 Tax=Mucilaginibacter phyllosphaerae TaxID=1812349 RepID=A0A4Y8A8G7_9SPHI|nr:long-chain fatty acid--CoA ligase [Mucilaginibacter phyllosphaerae]MBB3970975.1 long-chain acyl-CoA synthetase [Mucilaginibacter phyllosphaerae]TEW64093.1 long-chain fatty acid--CoA ligase [Mucilaginibacter phyllosphaerae]GGH05829.1 AMP-binding protein [Mucilaginibacter phyllosphaerae]
MNIVAEQSTIPELIRNIVANIHPEDHTFLIHKVKDAWVEISYKQALEKIDALSAWFLNIGIKKGDRLALIIENGPDYVYYDQALQQIGAVNTSIYPTLSESEMEYILNDSEARTVLAGNPFLFRKVLKIANNCKSLIRIIPAFDGFEKFSNGLQLNAGVVGFAQVIEEGLALVDEYRPAINAAREAILPTDLSCLIYTSGTTGTPKGVMLTHHNLTENCKVSLYQIPNVDKDDLFLSFLPLSHVFERTATYYICMNKGCKIAFAQSLELLAKNMAEVKPTIMCCVPRLLERIHDKAIKNGQSAGGVKTKIFNWALKTGREYRLTNEAGKTPGILLSARQKLADKLVFSKIKEKTGGRLKMLLSGGGALPKNVGEFFGDIDIKLLEGFGLTETSPVMAITENDRIIYGTVGRIIRGIEVGIQNVDTKHIYTKQTYENFNPDLETEEGEIIVRGHCVMKGYWKKPEETAAVIDSEGWFHTGDIGRFYRGNLQITDRLKNMLVNAYGKNVYPTPVENTYLKSPKIEQVFLIGDKREYITAILVPGREMLQETFKLGDDFFEKPELFIEDKEITDWVSQDVKRLSNELAKFERIKNFKVKRNPFSMEAGEITPTLKAKRKVIEKKYAEVIDDLYNGEDEAE